MTTRLLDRKLRNRRRLVRNAEGENCGTGAGGFQPGNTCGKGGSFGSKTDAVNAFDNRDAKELPSQGEMHDFLGNRLVSTRLITLSDDSYGVMIDFAIKGESSEHQNKRPEAESLAMAKKIKEAVKSYRSAGFKIMATPSDDKRDKAYSRLLTKMGLKRLPDKSGTQVWNARKVRPSKRLLRIDPTRTQTLRRAFQGKLRKQFGRLKAQIVRLVLVDDAFGLKERRPFDPLANYDPSQPRDPDGRFASGGGLDLRPTNKPDRLLAELSLGEESLGKVEVLTDLRPIATMENLEVWKEHRGKGVAKDLYKSVFQKLAQEGFTEVQSSELLQETGEAVWKSLQRDDPSIRYEAGVFKKPLTVNSNPEGCNQHTGPGCSLQSVKDKADSVLSSIFGKAKEALEDLAGDETDAWEGVKRMLFDVKKAAHAAEDKAGAFLSKMGLSVFNQDGTLNTRFAFTSDPEKVRAFQAWLRRQMRSLVSGVTEQQLWEAYVKAGYERGAGRAFDDTHRYRRFAPGEGDFYTGSRREFLKSSFGRPESVEKTKLLAGRSFDELEDVTREMSNKMSRALTDGLVEGKHPKEIARDLVKQVDLSQQRAFTIARTELIRAHAEGQLMAFRNLGVEELGVMVEWSTAGDDAVCDECQPMEGVVLKLDEASGMIPRHPNCRCSFIPANVGEGQEDQKRGQAEVRAAIRDSRSGEDEDDEEGWGPGQAISRERPASLLGNVEVRVSPALARFSEYITEEGAAE